MRHSLHSHVIYLENRVQSLKDQVTRSRLTADQVEGLEQQIALAELALARYREAYSLETRIASQNLPDGPGEGVGGESGTHQHSNRPKKGHGLTAFAAHARRKTRLRRPGVMPAQDTLPQVRAR